MTEHRKRQDSDKLLYLTEAQLKRSIEAMFFAYRGFTADPDRILEAQSLGRAHHRALHFIARQPGLTIGALLEVLGITKQSLNRVLRALIEKDLVVSEVGQSDRRARHLHLTEAGKALEAELSEAQQSRMREAFRQAGPEAVAGFREVLEAMMDERLARLYQGDRNGT